MLSFSVISFYSAIEIGPYSLYREKVISAFKLNKKNKEASTVLCSVVKYLGSDRALKQKGKTLDYVLCFPLHFSRALPLSCVLYNGTEHSRGFFIR